MIAFTGKERDAESGLDYFGARYFSGGMGRFTSPDWLASPAPVPYGDFSDPQTLNLFSYARNNPLSLVDPDGHCPWCIAGAVIGGLAGAGASIITQEIFDPQKDINWKAVAASTVGGIVAGGTLGMATAPAAMTTVLGGTSRLRSGWELPLAPGLMGESHHVRLRTMVIPTSPLALQSKSEQTLQWEPCRTLLDQPLVPSSRELQRLAKLCN